MADRTFTSNVVIQSDTGEDLAGISSSGAIGIGGGMLLSIEDTPATTDMQLNAERYFNSSGTITFSTVSGLQANRAFSSSVNINSVTTSSLSRDNRFSGEVNITPSLTSSLNANRIFSSAIPVSIVSVAESEVDKSFKFNSIVNINSNTVQVSKFYVDRYLNSNASVAPSITTTLERNSSFKSTVVIDFNISTITPKYNIVGDKKLEHLTNTLVSDHIGDSYPKLKDFMRVFLRYLDYNTAFKTYNIIDNNDLNKIYPEFINYYLNQFMRDSIDLTKYELTEQNKRLFLLISRLLFNSKGTQKSFSYLFNSLTDIRVADKDITIEVDKIITEYTENESWWSPGTVRYYDNTYTYNGAIDHSANYSKPFTYQFKIDQEYSTMLPLIREVHPAGFQQEFLMEMNFEDQQNTSSNLETSAVYFHYYNYGESGYTGYKYDGSITYDDSHSVVETG